MCEWFCAAPSSSRRLVINLDPAFVLNRRMQNESGVIHVMPEETAALPALGLPQQASHDSR